MNKSFFERGGFWVIGQSVLMVSVIALGVVFPQQWAGSLSGIAGAILTAVGAWIGIAGVQALGKNRTAFPKPLAGFTLIQTGVYGIVRHPLYASVILLTLGWSLLWRSFPALIVTALLIVFLDAKARREERWIRETCGDYAHYASRVRRLIPWIY